MKMTRLITSIVLISIISVFVSCHNDVVVDIEPETEIVTEIESNGDCVFEQIDENNDGLIDDTERSVMNDCTENNFTSISEIKNNIIGEWELVGYGHGWVPYPSQPCAHITVKEEELIFEFTNQSKDTITTYEWEIEEVFWSGGQYFRLNTLPEYVDGLYITYFCEKYMYGDGTPSDGNMYLYEKVD